MSLELLVVFLAAGLAVAAVVAPFWVPCLLDTIKRRK